MIQIPWSHLPPAPHSLPGQQTSQLPWTGSFLPPSPFLSPLPARGCFHGSHMSSTATTKIPSKQFLYQERGIQRFPDFLTRKSCILSKLQSNALLKGLLISSPKAVQAGVHSWSPWALPHQCQKWHSHFWHSGCVETQRNSSAPHVSSTKEWWSCRKAMAVTIMAWAPPLLLSSSLGFSRIAAPQHYKKTRKANPPFAHLRETPALFMSLCGCCQPFHTAHLYSFLLGACSLPRHH